MIGSALEPAGEDAFVIAHVVNDKGAWGAGFVVPLGERWPGVESLYKEDFKVGLLKFGYVRFVPVSILDRKGWVANMTAQSLGTRRPLSMVALQTCISKVVRFAAENNATVHSPRIGAGLAGGNWDEIESLLKYRSDWFVYTLPEETRRFPKTEYGQYNRLAQLSLRMSLSEENALVVKLRADGFTDAQIEKILMSVMTTCKYCWEGDENCQCTNDE